MEKKIFGFDVIRSLAILLVMVGHALGYIYSGEYSFFISFFSGFLGVELFFILSGVLIGNLLIDIFDSDHVLQHLKTFIIRRWLRTLPLYYIMLCIYWVGNTYFDTLKNNDVSLWKYILFLQSFFHIQSTFFGISWSLSIEEWFYIVFPLSLVIIKTFSRHCSTKKIHYIGIAIFLLYFLLIRNISFYHYHFTFYEGVRKITFLRLDAIAFGVLMACGFHFYPRKISEYKYVMLFIGIILLTFNQYLIFRNNYSDLLYFNTFYYSVLGAAIASLFPFFKEIKTSRVHFVNIVGYISKISYSLYLQHWLILKFLELPYFTVIPKELKFIMFLIFSFILASISYVYVEKPILSYRNKVYRK